MLGRSATLYGGFFRGDDMSVIFEMDLGCWRWGYVVLQHRYDANNFGELMRSRGGRYFLEYEGLYLSMHQGGGFCFVPPHPVPWLISVFTMDERHMLPKFAHEAVHLAEMLTASAGVQLSPATAEVRCQIVEHAVLLFEEKRRSGVFANNAQQQSTGFIESKIEPAGREDKTGAQRHQFRPQSVVPWDWSPGKAPRR